MSGVILDPDEGTFEDCKDEAMAIFFVDGVVDMRGIVSDRNAIAISWVFSIVEELVKHCHGRIIHCDASTYATGFREIRLMVDQSGEPVVLPAITPAEHFSVIVHPVASGLPYIAYLLESMEAFHGNRVIGITGICTDSQSDGMHYCIRIVEELKRNENAMEVAGTFTRVASF
ncbi:hypothetical protein GQ55_2G050800 [Panicum hallii var. hallii]|uniref:Uncharacterized protein n=1 Tax=Panicum hallii var. hallii TaxID=1504633 RepID=A0A2T7ELL5_9POAL|nr:hypothetical protein GQ55_2G050800 [Panicum hallii var. hallii]